MIIAIDGPAGSGKSTVAKMVAEQIGFAYLDTGAMYRAVCARALEAGIDPGDEMALGAIARDERISFGYTPGEALPTEVYIAGADVTRAIRTPRTDTHVSTTSALPAVRSALTEQQRRLGHERDTVMEGRDIGTVVFPDAELKVFLTAAPEARAARRAAQNAARGLLPTTPDALKAAERTTLEDILRRDAEDTGRDTAPLAAAPDSVLIDTTDLRIDEVVDCIVGLAYSRGAQGEGARRRRTV
ncbi:MAG: (d)CMP kinase [Coriobacteriales bacterium]|jgi:cytidylate kinase|nr:(d)CMP kinase [Coriobacteriales bacterium]